MKKQDKRTHSAFGTSIAELFVTYDVKKLIEISIALAIGLFCLDYFDIPSRGLEKAPLDLIAVIAVALIVIIILCLVQMHIFDLFKMISVNLIDAIAEVAVFSSAFYALPRWLVLGKEIYINCAVIVFTVCGLLLLTRIVVRWISIKKSSETQSNLVDLKSIYENDFERKSDNPILLLEKDVDYDLIGRHSISNQLYRSITHCQPEQSYVISLEGAWGVGKTTILNGVKQVLRSTDDRFIVIDDFEPWLYGSQEALLWAMYESIINHAGLRYSPLKNNKIGKGLSKAVTEGHAVGGVLYDIFIGYNECGDIVSELKSRISSYLQTKNRIIVFIIDNLDRTSDDNIVFLFKLISIVFDLPGVVYVLSFEKERINSALKNTHEIDPRFIDKIVQQEIRVPVIATETMETVYRRCMHNLLISYGVSLEEIEEYDFIIKYIILKSQDLRAFKRMINSVLSIVFCEDSLLYKVDLLAIELIRFYETELYDQIHKNKKFFVSHEKGLENFMLRGDKHKFNEEGKKFFDELFKVFGDDKELLATIFPYVDRYLKGSDLEGDYIGADQDNREIFRLSRVCDGKYFDLYFSYGSNNYIRMRKDAEGLIHKLNACNSLRTAEKDIYEAFKNIHYYDHGEFVEHLQHHLSEMKQEKIRLFILGFFSRICDVSDSLGFELGAKTRLEYIISELIVRCTDKDYEEILQVISGDYSKLNIIYSIYKWLESDKFSNSEIRHKRAEQLKPVYLLMCERVAENRINLYEDTLYLKGNIWGLYWYYKDTNRTEEMMEYIASVITPKNIYRILWDIISCSISQYYMYSINSENFSAFFIDDKLVEKMINDNLPKNENERTVKRIYEAYKYGEPDEWGHKGVKYENPLILDL